MTIQAGSSAEAATQAPRRAEFCNPRRRAQIYRSRRNETLRLVDPCRPRAMGSSNLHHPRHRNPRRASRPGRQSDHRRSRRAIESIRTLEAARRCGAKDLSSQTFRRYSRAARSRRASGTFANRRFARKRLRAREVVPGRRAGKMPHAERHGKHHGVEPRSERTRTRVGRLALDRAAHAPEIFAHGGARQ